MTSLPLGVYLQHINRAMIQVDVVDVLLLGPAHIIVVDTIYADGRHTKLTVMILCSRAFPDRRC